MTPSVPGYAVGAPLGQGGVATVWAARREADGLEVALKLVPPATDKDRARGSPSGDRVDREIDALRKVEHPHVARLLDHGALPDGRRWLAQELAPGLPLSELLKLQVLGPRSLADVLGKVALALAAAHARGVVHRDVKPANVVVDGRLSPKLVDFGMATLQGGLALTGPGVAVGTPSYMSPEVLEAGSATAGPPCDVWALGVILAEGLLREHPFAQSDVGGTVQRVLRAELPPLPATTPPDLVVACQAALQRDPARRPGAEALALLLGATPVVAPAPRPGRRPGAASEASRAPAQPARAGPYVLERRIGEGEGGSVHIGVHDVTGARHAVKLLGLGATASAARLEREAQALARIPPHSGVATVHHLGRVEGDRPFYAMDLVDGPSLRELLGRGPLPPADVARLGAALARALAHVHARGVIHRDVKPENIVLRDGRLDAPVLVDFGVALATAEDRLTRTGLVPGTPLYMAPEQLAADASAVGPRTDVFALAVVLHEAAGGAHPFEAEGLAQLLLAVARATPPPLGPEARGLALALEPALRKDRTRRPDALAFAALLDAAARDPRGPATPRRGLALVGGALVLLGVAAAVTHSPARGAGAATTAATSTTAPSTTHAPAAGDAARAEAEAARQAEAARRAAEQLLKQARRGRVAEDALAQLRSMPLGTARATGAALALAAEGDVAPAGLALVALADALGPAALPPAAAAPLAARGAARWAEGDAFDAVVALGWAAAADPSQHPAIPDMLELDLTRGARERFARGDLPGALALVLASLRLGLPLDIQEHDLFRLGPLVEGATADDPARALLAAIAPVAGALDDTLAHRRAVPEAAPLRRAVARLEELVADWSTPPTLRGEAAAWAISGLVQVDPLAAAARADELLARPWPGLATWRVAWLVVDPLVPHDPQAALAWARRAAAALDDPDAPRPTHRDVTAAWSTLVGTLLGVKATGEVRALIEEAHVRAALGRSLGLVRARLAHAEGDDAAARRLADQYLETNPDDAVARRWRDGLGR